MTPKIAKAQLKINSFNSNGKPDWVEVFNESDSEISFNEYLILDLAGNKIESELIIPAKGNCIFDFSNRLNNTGDVIFLQKNNQQIDCKKYGDAESDCENLDPIENKLNINCYKKIPEPVQTVSATPKPTVMLTPKPTPAPTVYLTPKPKSSAEVLSIETSKPTPTFKPMVDDTEELSITNSEEKNNFFSNFLILVGVFLSVGGLASIFYKEYNQKYFESKKFY